MRDAHVVSRAAQSIGVEGSIALSFAGEPACRWHPAGWRDDVLCGFTRCGGASRSQCCFEQLTP